LTTFKTDEDIIENLGKLPPTLEQLYSTIYNRITINQGQVSQVIARNALCFLLRGKENLEVDDFLLLVAPKSHQGSIEETLAICCNLVVFDESINVFRFAHLSVREFLETLPEFAAQKPHSNIVKCCMGQLDGNILFDKSKDVSDLDLYMGNWLVYHCQIAGPEERQHSLEGEIISFLQRKDLSSLQAGAYLNYKDQCILPPPQDFGPMASILFAACGVGFSEVVLFAIDKLPSSGDKEKPLPQARPSSRSLTIFSYSELQAACLYEFQHAQNISSRQMFSNLASYATRHCNYHVLELCLRRNLVDIPGDLFLPVLERPRCTSGASYKRDQEILALLLDFCGTNWVTPEAMRKIVEYRHSWRAPETSLTLLEMMLSRGLKFAITDDFVNSIDLGEQKSTDALFILIDANSDWKIQSSFLETVIRSGGASRWQRNPQSYELLFRLLRRCDSAAATQALLQAAAGEHTVRAVQSILNKNPNLVITEEILVSAAGNDYYASSYDPRVLEYLLSQSEYPVSKQNITQKVLEAAAKSSTRHSTFSEVLDSNSSLSITEDVLVSAVSNRHSNLLEYMLKEVDPPLIQPHQLTQRVLNAATERISSDYIEAILEANPLLSITEETLITATRNIARGLNYRLDSGMLEYLVQRSGLQVTQQIAEAAVSVGWCGAGASTLNMVLKTYPHLQATQDMLSIAVEHQDGDLVDVILRWNPDLEITDGVLRIWERR